jgi:coenzyme F420-0:L-glutamate ligase/coenzyme F420-1:gamma-L-glutamate ligase
VSSRIELFTVDGIPEVQPGDDLAGQILAGLERQGDNLREGDILVVTQKVVSKAEGCVVELSTVKPSELAQDWADRFNKDARVVELVLRESARIVRMDRGVIISQTRHGFICANAGIDNSNVNLETVTLLPPDPDASAQRIRDAVKTQAGVNVGVVISDTFGRAWREGQTNVAIGIAGVEGLRSFEGALDPAGYELRVTKLATADELASAAELVQGKLDRSPVAVVRGLARALREGSTRELIRAPELDMFR